MHGESHVDSNPELAYKLMQFSGPVMGMNRPIIRERACHYILILTFTTRAINNTCREVL